MHEPHAPADALYCVLQETCSGEYLFDLDHFVAMHRMARETPSLQHSPGKLIPMMPDDFRERDLAARDLHLSIDAESCGEYTAACEKIFGLFIVWLRGPSELQALCMLVYDELI